MTYDEGYEDALNSIPIWQAFGQNRSNRAYVEGYVSAFAIEDQAWVRSECWATMAFARGKSDKRPSLWGVNELPVTVWIS